MKNDSLSENQLKRTIIRELTDLKIAAVGSGCVGLSIDILLPRYYKAMVMDIILEKMDLIN